jgi:hypothetical protein
MGTGPRKEITREYVLESALETILGASRYAMRPESFRKKVLVTASDALRQVHKMRYEDQKKKPEVEG